MNWLYFPSRVGRGVVRFCLYWMTDRYDEWWLIWQLIQGDAPGWSPTATFYWLLMNFNEPHRSPESSWILHVNARRTGKERARLFSFDRIKFLLKHTYAPFVFSYVSGCPRKKLGKYVQSSQENNRKRPRHAYLKQQQSSPSSLKLHPVHWRRARSYVNNGPNKYKTRRGRNLFSVRGTFSPFVQIRARQLPSK